MAKVVFDDLSICGDCLQIIANDEGGDDEARNNEIREAIRNFEVSEGGFIAVGMEEYGFSRSSCDICSDNLAGDRYQAIFLVESE